MRPRQPRCAHLGWMLGLLLLVCPMAWDAQVAIARPATPQEQLELEVATERSQLYPEYFLSDFQVAPSGVWAAAQVYPEMGSGIETGIYGFDADGWALKLLMPRENPCFGQSLRRLGMPRETAADLGFQPCGQRTPNPRTKFQPYEARGGVGISIRWPEPAGDCRERRTPLTLTLRGGGDRMRLHTVSTCNGHWRKRGDAPGVRFESSFWSYPRYSGTTVLMLVSGFTTFRREYRFELRAVDRRMVGWVTAANKEAREERIFEGADAFVNFCINRGKEIRSSNGRLYCTRIVGERGFLALHPHRWGRLR